MNIDEAYEHELSTLKPNQQDLVRQTREQRSLTEALILISQLERKNKRETRRVERKTNRRSIE